MGWYGLDDCPISANAAQNRAIVSRDQRSAIGDAAHSLYARIPTDSLGCKEKNGPPVVGWPSLGGNEDVEERWRCSDRSRYTGIGFQQKIVGDGTY